MKVLRVEERSAMTEPKLQEAPVPRAAPDMLLVRIRAAGVNFADVLQLRGEYPRILPTPYVPGYEIAGEIVEIGANVAGFAHGERIASLLPMGGGFAEYALVPHRLAVKVPDALDDAAATALLTQGLTAFIMVEKFVRPATTVLITAAAGGVGSLALQLAISKGARVYGAAGSPEKCELVARMGAIAVDYRSADWAPSLRNRIDPFDVVLDAVGGNVLLQAWTLLKEFGALVSYGNASGEDVTLSASQMSALPFGNHSLHFFGFTHHLEADPALYRRGLATLFDLKVQGVLGGPKPRPYPLEDAARALSDLAERNTTGKVVLLA